MGSMKDIWTERKQLEADMRKLSYQESKRPTLGGSDAMFRMTKRYHELPVVYRVPDPNLVTLNERFGKMEKQAGRIARKTGMMIAAPRIIEHEDEIVEVKRDGQVEKRRYVFVTIEGGQVRIPGWQFLATLQHTEAGNVVRRIPTAEWEGSLEAYRSTEPTCDHCHVNRQRIDTYIVLNEAENKTMQVGSTCLRDFTGGLSPAQCASWAEHLFEALDDAESEPSDESWGRGRRGYVVKDILLMAAALIRTEGYTSARDEWGEFRPGTSRWTRDALTRTGRFTPNVRYGTPEVPPTITEEDEQAVVNTLAWLADNQDDSEFMQNLRVQVQRSWCEDRDAGMIAFAPEGYRRHVAKIEREKVEAKARAESSHLGTVGDKLTLDVKVIEEKLIDSEWGVSYLYTFACEDGNFVKWFASREQEFEVGDSITLTGKVKKHDEFRGKKETVLTRCRATVLQK